MCAQVGEIYADLDLANLSAGDLILLKPFGKAFKNLKQELFWCFSSVVGHSIEKEVVSLVHLV